jgi:hypothetical protein
MPQCTLPVTVSIKQYSAETKFHTIKFRIVKFRIAPIRDRYGLEILNYAIADYERTTLEQQTTVKNAVACMVLCSPTVLTLRQDREIF